MTNLTTIKTSIDDVVGIRTQDHRFVGADKFTGLWRPVICATSKKLPNVYKSCPKMISLEKLNVLTPLQKLDKNVGDLSKLIIAKGFEKLPKVQ